MLLSERFEFTENNGADEGSSLLDNSFEQNPSETNLKSTDSLEFRIKQLEDEVKLKTLEIIEKEGTIETLESENCVLKEDVIKIKDDLQLKIDVIESNVGTINTLEEKLKKKTQRVNILEPYVNSLLNKKNEAASINDKDVTVLKNKIKSKNEIIKQLREDKGKLAKELSDLQEKVNSNGDSDIVGKCIKLTTENNELKAVKKNP